MIKTDDHSKWLQYVGAGVLLLAALVPAWLALPVKAWLEAFQQWIAGQGAWRVAGLRRLSPLVPFNLQN